VINHWINSGKFCNNCFVLFLFCEAKSTLGLLRNHLLATLHIDIAELPLVRASSTQLTLGCDARLKVCLCVRVCCVCVTTPTFSHFCKMVGKLEGVRQALRSLAQWSEVSVGQATDDDNAREGATTNYDDNNDDDMRDVL
jgi:hypothetical protein